MSDVTYKIIKDVKRIPRKCRLKRVYKQTFIWKKKKLKRSFFSKKQSIDLPHVLLVRMFRRNVYLHISDLSGTLRFSLSAGYNFIGRNKIAYMAIISLTLQFLAILEQLQYKKLFIEFRNMRQGRFAFIKTLKKFKKAFKFVGCMYRFNLQFNGCRHKKVRRK